MRVLEFINIFLAVSLCLICIESDFSKGIIRNKVLVAFSLIAIVDASIYYGIYARDILMDFIANLGIVTIVCLYLFYSHSFAGGDCKMAIVLALLYPARKYLIYRGSILTLVFAIGFAILAGYIYLLIQSFFSILTKKTMLSKKYIKSVTISFLKSYISAMLYIILLNSCLIFLNDIGISINIWISRCACMAVAWCVGRYSCFRKIWLLAPTTATIVLISLANHSIPISLNPESYILILIFLLCQMMIRATIYETIPIDQLKKGMILTTMSSIVMQPSITKGLPGVSTEDLRSRLTSEEIESVKIWAIATHTKELTIVKKIPFAIFISIGYISYYILWRILI